MSEEGVAKPVAPQPPAVDTEQIRIQAAVQEMNGLIQAQLQRSIDLSGQLAVSQYELKAARDRLTDYEKQIADLHHQIEGAAKVGSDTPAEAAPAVP